MSTMTDRELPILYIKTDCPWCRAAVEFLRKYGIEYEEKNVTSDSQAFAEMKKKSSQSKAPTLDWHGRILPDFGVDELKAFLLQQNVKLEDS